MSILSNRMMNAIKSQEHTQNMSRIATVVGTMSGSVYLIFDGETESTRAAYRCLSSYSPQVNDRVMVVRTGSSWVVTGKIGQYDGTGSGGNTGTGTSTGVELIINKVTEINESNIGSTTKYPSVKAVVDKITEMLSGYGGGTSGGDGTQVSKEWVKSLFAYENKVLDNVSVAANTSVDSSISVTKSGYTPVGIMGVLIRNATSSGAQWGNVSVVQSYIAGGSAGIRLFNKGTNAAKVKITATIFYIAN